MKARRRPRWVRWRRGLVETELGQGTMFRVVRPSGAGTRHRHISRAPRRCRRDRHVGRQLGRRVHRGAVDRDPGPEAHGRSRREVAPPDTRGLRRGRGHRTNLCTTRTRPRHDLSVTWPSQGTFPRSHPSARGPALTTFWQAEGGPSGRSRPAAGTQVSDAFAITRRVHSLRARAGQALPRSRNVLTRARPHQFLGEVWVNGVSGFYVR